MATRHLLDFVGGSVSSSLLGRVSWFLLAAPALACSATPERNAFQGTGGIGAAPGSGGFANTGGASGGGGLPPSTGGSGIGALPGGGGTTGSGGAGGACTGVSQKAEKILGGKADIIWVLDNSGSMFDESQGIQNNMNSFSEFITKTGIDVHVVAVSSGIPSFSFGICIAPPLGSGQPCPNDSNPPLYTHVLQEVSSWDALFQLMNTYPQWQGVIRPDSTKTFVVVTDDEAQPLPTAAEFKQFFDNAWQGSTWRFSGVFCKAPALNCFRVGTVYDGLVQQTGGVFADLGTPGMDWSAIFKQLGDAIVADAKPVDCEWLVPAPPMGQTFDPDKVNVVFTPTSGVQETIFGVDDVAQCNPTLGGWFYSPDKTKVVACPQSCTKIQADDNAKIDVSFGCKRERPPIE